MALSPFSSAAVTVLKPLRSRANLRPASRFASVIDRLLRNQSPLENHNNLRSSSPHLVLGRRPGNRAAILRSEIHGHGSHSCSDHRCGSGTRRRAAWRPPPREDPAQARHALAGGFDNRTTGSSKRSRCSLHPGMTPVPITFFRPQNRGAVIQALPADG